MPALLAGALVIAAAAGGVGIGHVLWPGTQAASSSPIATSTGGGTGSSRSGTSNGTSPQAPGHSSSNGSGSNGSGSTGNGGTGSGQSNGNGNTTNGGTNNGNSNGNNNGNGNGGTGGFGDWPPDQLPGGLLPGQGQWPGLGSGNGSGGNGSGGNGSSTGGVITSAPGAPSDISGILNKVDKAVVDIDVTFAYQQAEGAGTGIVLTKNGEVLTNNHVIDGATSISVTDLGNGKTYGASVVGYDPSGDVAVLQLKDASGLTTATIGNSTSLAVGNAVVGIGNAGGVGGTPSAAGGSVTALHRSISVGDDLYGTTAHLTGLIEVNSDIQPGDSGGPLVTSSGAVVGMDTAASAGTSDQTGGHEGFAIPINTALSVAKNIESGHGSATIHVGATAALGVLVSTSGQTGNSGRLPGQFGTNGGTENATPVSGALVAGVIDGGAAAKADMQEGDVITSLGGHSVTSSSQLSRLMLTYRPGQKVKVGWTDADGQAHTATITLGTGPAA